MSPPPLTAPDAQKGAIALSRTAAPCFYIFRTLPLLHEVGADLYFHFYLFRLFHCQCQLPHRHLSHFLLIYVNCCQRRVRNCPEAYIIESYNGYISRNVIAILFQGPHRSYGNGIIISKNAVGISEALSRYCFIPSYAVSILVPTAVTYSGFRDIPSLDSTLRSPISRYLKA